MAGEDIGTLLSKIALDVTDLKNGAQAAKGELNNLKTFAADFSGQIKKALTFAGVAVGIYEIATAIKEFAKDAANVGARTETLQISADQIGKTYKMSAESVKYFVEQGKAAGITTQESLVAVSKFLTSGLPLDQLKDLATRARDIAVVAGVGTSEAFNRIIQGIITGEQETLRRMMIQIGSQDEGYGRYAATLGKTKDQLNSVEKAQAMLNEVMRLSAGFTGVAAAADESVGKQLASMARYAQEAKNALWPIFQPAFLAWVQEMTRGYKDLETWAKANKDRLAEWGREGAEWVKWLATGIRDIGAFIAKNQDLIKAVLELYIASKAAGWIAGIGTELKKTAVEVGVTAALLGKLKSLIGGPWKIAITIGLIGLYEAWKAILDLRAAGAMPTPSLAVAVKEGMAKTRAQQNKDLDIAGGVAATEAQRRGISLEEYLRLQKADQKRAIEGQYKRYSAPPLTPPPLSEFETPDERAAREAKEAHDKSLRDAPKPLPKESKGGGKEEKEEDIFGEELGLREVQRQAKVQAAQDSLEILKSGNEKERAELEKKLAEGLIDGTQYYASLQELQQKETASALTLIDEKKRAQQQAYQDALTGITKQEEQGDISPEMAQIKRQEELVKNRMALAQLDTETAKVRLDGEKKITDELTRQVKLRQEIQDKVTGLNIETAQLTGAISEQEAKMAKLAADYDIAVRKAKEAGEYTPEMSRAMQQNMEAKQADIQYGALSRSIVDGLSQLMDTLMQGGADLKQAANNFFKSLFKESLKPGLEQLKNLLTQGFKDLFGVAGGAIASALIGAIALIGMMLTQATSSSYSASSLEGGVTAHEAVRGIIAGDTSIPIVQIGQSLKDALLPTNGILNKIELNTRGGSGGGLGGTLEIRIDMEDMQQQVYEAIEQYLRDFFLRGGK